MWSTRHRVVARILTGAVAFCAALVVMAFSAPAFAAPGQKGRVEHSLNEPGLSVKVNGRSVSTTLIGIVLEDGTRLKTYCVDFTVVSKDGSRVIEDDWSKYPNPSTKFKAKPENVNWILHNSYPVRPDTGQLGKEAGITNLTAKQAIAGTQLAIWHFSNGTKPDANNNANVVALYKYLTGPANVGGKPEPSTSLAITPDSLDGKAGGKIGPFKIETSAKEVPLKVEGPDGVTLVDKDGKPVTKAKNGADVYLQVPAGTPAGSATIKAEVEATIQTGRLFRGDKGDVTQTLITATAAKTKVKAEAKGTWTVKPTESPSPTPSQSVSPSPSVSPSATGPASPTPSYEGGGGTLPLTGSNVALVAGIGAALLAIGASVFFIARKKRSA